MEIDQLKEVWNTEHVSEIPEISTEKQKEMHLPLEKIRKNMRMEFWSSVFAIILILFYFVLNVEDFKLQAYGLILTMSAIIVTAFYYHKFFLLYKEIGEHKFTTKEMLKDLKTQFDLNQQYYTSYYVAFVPIIVASYILIFDNQNAYEKYSTLKFIFALSITVCAGIGGLYFIGKWWFNQYYGKYIDQIENLIQNLK